MYGCAYDKYLLYTQTIIDFVYILEVHFPSSCVDVAGALSSYNGMLQSLVGVCL